MARFIVLTFAFLGWAFYELSGGADFEPANARLTNIKADPLKPTQTADGTRSQSQTDDVGVEVTRVSLNLTSVNDVLNGAAQAPEPKPVALKSAEPEIIPVAANGDTPAIIPSLITGARVQLTPESVATVSAASSDSAADIRAVKGSRVNVRSGPGTSYGVVAGLSRGAQVEILEDAGNGWVRFQALDGSAEGWMADFLLSDG